MRMSAGASVVALLLCMAAVLAVGRAETPPYEMDPTGAKPWGARALHAGEARDADTYMAAKMDKNSYHLSKYAIDTTVNNQLVHGWVIKVDNAAAFHISQPTNGCPGFIRTSVTAFDQMCDAATNAGFFDVVRGGCLGALVTDGHLVQGSPRKNAAFGITTKGELFAGYLAATDDLSSFQQLVQGVGWLVRNGTNNVATSVSIEGPSFDFVHEKAPRTAVGWTAAGELVIATVDGAEDEFRGLSMSEWADVLVAQGLQQAINLDGGGSTTAVYGGQVISHPSDICGLGQRCERAVTSVTCIRHPSLASPPHVRKPVRVQE